ncbi:MAG: hypothetical protein J3R72DRAFT_15263 [Linnemannia gamsii]|nr:MAG: hypothetical protein J3R72DRAFT_15263 [Linnemannia gamsii]
MTSCYTHNQCPLLFHCYKRVRPFSSFLFFISFSAQLPLSPANSTFLLPFLRPFRSLLHFHSYKGSPSLPLSALFSFSLFHLLLVQPSITASLEVPFLSLTNPPPLPPFTSSFQDVSW